MARPTPSSSSRSRRSRTLLVAGLLAAGLTAGCGSDDGGGGGPKDFTGRAERICTEAFRDIAAEAKKGEQGSQASKVRTDATAQLRKLTPPPEKVAQFTRLLTARDDIVSAYEEARKGSGDITDARTGRSLDALERSADAAKQVGLPACAL